MRSLEFFYQYFPGVSNGDLVYVHSELENLIDRCQFLLVCYVQVFVFFPVVFFVSGMPNLFYILSLVRSIILPLKTILIEEPWT